MTTAVFDTLKAFNKLEVTSMETLYPRPENP